MMAKEPPTNRGKGIPHSSTARAKALGQKHGWPARGGDAAQAVAQAVVGAKAGEAGRGSRAERRAEEARALL